jgi:CDP-4-dehydro-6-deoxyglucose reductase
MPGGKFTDHVFGALKERDILRFEAPLGTFFLREDSDKPIVLLASGTGFAPLKGIVEHALHKKLNRPMTLYWGARQKKDLYLMDLAEQWAKDIPNFRFVPVLSEPAAGDNWTGRAGFVHRAVIEDLPDLSGYQVYACGAPVMVESALRDFTQHHGLPEGEFFADSFTSAADLANPV